MLRWLPSGEGLDTLDIEAARARDAARMARLGPVGPGPITRLADALRARLADRHSLTEHPCRMPDGSIGRTAIRRSNGEWVAVCVLPRTTRADSLHARFGPEATWASHGW